MKRSLNVLSETIDQTYPHLSAALDGVARFSDTIGKRDEQIRQLLANANKIAGVLGNRSEQVNALLVNAQTLLARDQRTQPGGQRAAGAGVDRSRRRLGFIDDNPNLNHVLEQLRTISDILKERKFDLVDTLTTLAKFTASLAEAVASGPSSRCCWSTCCRTDPAAVRRRRVQEARHRPRGVLAQRRPARLRFPDPNGTRLPKGPRAGADVLEGTPEHPGPAVSPARRARTPHRPTACRAREIRCRARTCRPARSDRTRIAPQLSAAVLTSPPNPTACRHARRARAAIPGQLPPDVPGACRCPPAPPGARTVPLGRCLAPPDFTPGIAPCRRP